MWDLCQNVVPSLWGELVVQTKSQGDQGHRYRNRGEGKRRGWKDTWKSVDGIKEQREGRGRKVTMFPCSRHNLHRHAFLFHPHENPVRANVFIPIAQMRNLRHREVKENISIHTPVNGRAGRWPAMLIMQLVFMFSCPDWRQSGWGTMPSMMVAS
jgi:hypothetical protein